MPNTPFKDFRYKVLLLDDLQSAHEKGKSLRDFGVDLQSFSSIRDCLENAFHTKDGFPSHEYDIVLIDYFLEPEMTEYPNGGLAIYPLFVHGYQSDTPGPCVVCAYSAVLGDNPSYCELFQLGEKVRLRSEVSYRQAGFGDFSLAPLIQARATSLLRECPVSSIMEASAIWLNENLSLDEALDTELAGLSEILKRRVSLRKLRPDFGQQAFSVSSQPVYENQHLVELDAWLHDLIAASNYAHEAYKVYTYNGVPNIYDWAHKTGSDENANDPRPALQLQGGQLNLDRLRTLHEAHVRALTSIDFKSPAERCTAVHRAFRLCMDASLTAGVKGFDAGYFLADVKAAVPKLTLAPMSIDKGGYVYVPSEILCSMLSDLVVQVNKEACHVVVVEEGRYVAFVFQFRKNDPISCDAIARAKWSVLKHIGAWGEFAIFDDHGIGGVVMGKRFYPMSRRFATYPQEICQNACALILPLKDN